MLRGAGVFELRGVPGMEQDLTRISRARRDLLERAGRTSALAVRRLARAHAPKDKGDLIAAIDMDGKGLRFRVGIDDRAIPSRGGSSAHQYPWVYGVWYETGFTTRKIDSHPFMGPARDAEEGAHVERVRAAWNASV